MDTKNKIISCYALTNSFGISHQGKLVPCCKFKGDFKDIRNVVDFNDINKSDPFVNLSKAHSRGDFTKGCRRCELDESEKIISRREQLGLFFNNLGMNSSADYFIDLNIGNYCNLKCRMCNSDSSSMWKKDRDNLIKKGLWLNVSGTESDFLIQKSDIKKIILFIEALPGRVHLEIKGGEPLILKTVEYLFNSLSKLSNSKNISISLVTNGTRIPSWLSVVGDKLKKIDLFISVDGLERLYEYIRGGEQFSWQAALENIKKERACTGINLKFGVVVQNYNILQLKDIIDFLLHYVKDINDISFMSLRQPDFLQSYILPKRLKVGVKFSLSHYADQPTIARLINNIDKDYTETQKDNFLKYSQALDEMRGQSLKEVLPELADPTLW